MQKRVLFLMSMLLMLSLTAMAQITTSSLTGKVVVEGANESAIGATVQAVHEPSGTRYAAVTNASGRFTIQGMRTGGPYTVTISYIGFQPKNLKNITLELGETFNINATLSEDASELGEVIVSGKASKFATEKTGASTNINNRTIQSMPTISRSIGDIAKISPYYGGSMSLAGGNGKMTNFTLDGANLNNNFGLSANLPGGGSPVSIDAIDEVQVVIAPFDVRQTNFIGGGINAVTKSGTNQFKGTAYFYYTNEDLHGNRVDGVQNTEPLPAAEKIYGFTLGGPIIKNKLFFFANYERTDAEDVPTLWHPSTDGVADSKTYTSRTSIADLDAVSEHLRNKYGYDTGSATDYPGGIINNKFLARIDWNITNNHHLALRFNHTNNSSWSIPSKTSRDIGGLNTACVSINSIAYANAFYEQKNKVTTIAADLNSRLGNKASNQLLVTYTAIDDPRESDSELFPSVDIMKDGNPYITLGYEVYSFNNRVKNNVFSVTDNFTYFMGAHKLTAGFNYEHQTAENSYMRNGTGNYRYASVADFLSGAAPVGVALAYGYDGEEKPKSKVGFNQIGFYLQDEWNIFDNLKLTAGVRFDDILFNNSDLTENPAIYELDFGGRHLDVSKWPDNKILISPRIGFSWDVFGDKMLKFRGGTGIFTGRLPLVFFTNMPQNAGMLQNLVIAKAGDSRLANFVGGLVTDVDQIRQKLDAPYSQNANGVVPSSIAGVDKDFKMPQVWKSSFAVDYKLPVSFPLTLTGELTYTKNINAVMLENWNEMPVDDTWQRFSGADNRLIYPKVHTYYPTKQINNACVLTNTSKGYGWTGNITLNAEPFKDLSLMLSYTHTVMKEVTGMPGSNASSAYSYLHTVNGPSIPEVRNSAFVTPDRVIGSLNYSYKKDHFSLFYTGYSHNYYSFLYDNDLNGDGLKYDLMYIPANDNEIKFATEADRFAFWEFVEQDEYLRNHKGEYAEAYGTYTPWVHRFDFKWVHDFTLCLGKTHHKLQFIANIENIGNLLNSKWGVTKYAPTMSNNAYRLLSVDRIEDNVPVFRMVSKEKQTWDYNHSFDQCWQLQVGAKYYFDQLTDEESERLCKPCREELTQMDIDKLNAMVADRDAENARLKAEVAALQAEKRAEVKPEVKIVEKEVQVAKVVTAPASVFFNSGKSTIASKKELENVKELARVARENNAKVVVTGYADSKTGNAELNKRLSQQRAETIANQLVAMGVSRENIEIVAAGGVDDLNPYNYNRRVTVILK